MDLFLVTIPISQMIDVEDEILTLAEADALKDEDFIEYNEFLEKESDDDNNLIKEGD